MVAVAAVHVMEAGGPRQAMAQQHLGTSTVVLAVVVAAAVVAVTTVPGRELTSMQKWTP